MSLKKFENFNELFSFQNNENTQNRVDDCVNVIVSFLKDNQIETWTEFIETSKFDKFVIGKIIDSYCDDLNDLNQVRFKLRLKLSDSDQLKDMIKEYESLEEYEKCSEIKSEIKKRIK
jgi:hypothetical protein